jgi:N-dimethylarginine dimethylaminohydrolase
MQSDTFVHGVAAPNPVIYGVNSEYGGLRSVLLRRPGREIEQVTEPRSVLFTDFVDPDLARREHDGLAEQLALAGVHICYIQGGYDAWPNLYFTRDTVLTTISGATFCRPASWIRRGERRAISQALMENGIPCAFDVSAPGILEGGDICILSPHLVLIGISTRTNLEGAGQLVAFLQQEGFSNIHLIPLELNILHLDMMLAVLDRDLVAVSDQNTPSILYKVMAEHGIRVLNLPHDEVSTGMALNLLCLGPRHVILPSGNPNSRRLLERAGVVCNEVNVSELAKGGGGIHCMVAVLSRDYVR